jgi:hypothetical protein
LELDMAAVPPLVSGVWDVLLQALADSGGHADALQMIDSTTVRAHRCAGGEKGGIQNRALGRCLQGMTGMRPQKPDPPHARERKKHGGGARPACSLELIAHPVRLFRRPIQQ